jgi:hypothetical protein
MRNPASFVDGLIDDLDKFARDNPELAAGDGDAEDLAEELDPLVRAERRGDADVEQNREDVRAGRVEEFDPRFDDGDIDLGATEPLDEPAWFQDLRGGADDLVHTRASATKAFQAGRRRVRYRLKRGKIGTALARFWLGLIDAAPNIRGIAEQAIIRRVRVRWFDFDKFAQTRVPRGGVRNFLVPLNAVEQASPPRVGLSYLARLSPINEACLAFLAPPSMTRLGVVFCGDSPLGDGPGYGTSFLGRLPSPPLAVVATAPHHGSESNRVAYRHLSAWTDVITWVRTGGLPAHPGGTFKALHFPERICTHCPQSNKFQLRTAGVGGFNRRPYFLPHWVMGYHCTCT